MGFLSAYSGTTTVAVGDGTVDYWVELKDCLSQGEKEAAERSLTSGSLTPGQTVQMTMDVARYRQLMVLASIKSWNLDDEAGKVWPVDLEHVQLLPGNEFDKLWTVVNESNAPASREDRKTFREDGVSGDADGNTRAA